MLISLFRRGLKAIEEALEADRPDTITKAGVVIAAGPDHYARLAAVARLLQVLTAGRPKPKPAMIDPKRGLLSLAEVEAQVHGATEE